MSLDLDLLTPEECPHCGGLLRTGDELFSINITHNLIPMWKKAGVYDALYMSEGHRAGEFVASLKAGVEDFRANFREYEKLNSPNGWGLAANALPFLEHVHAAFTRYPDAIIRISK